MCTFCTFAPVYMHVICTDLDADLCVHLRTLIAPLCHTPISLASQEFAAARSNFIVGIGDRMGQGAIGHVNYSLTRRSIPRVSPSTPREEKIEISFE